MEGDKSMPSQAPSIYGSTPSTAAPSSTNLQSLLDLTSKKGVLEENRETEALVCSQISSLFSNTDQLSAAFLQLQGRDGSTCTSNAAEIDFKAVRTLYQNLKAMDSAPIIKAIMDASRKLLQAVAGRHHPFSSVTALRCCLIVLVNPFLLEPENHQLIQSVAKHLTAMDADNNKLLVQTLSSLSAEELEEMVATVQQCITVQMYEAGRASESVQLCTMLLYFFYLANRKAQLLPASIFYNDAVNAGELVRLEQQYDQWNHPSRFAFSFCQYAFILDTASKAKILHYESAGQKSEAFYNSFWQGIISQGGIIEPYNIMRVRRDNIVHDAITHMQRRQRDSKKPLQVQFIGEEGLDEGGLRNEFFQLVVQQLFSAQYGMFAQNDETRQFWFTMQPEQLDQIQQAQGRKHAQLIQAQQRKEWREQNAEQEAEPQLRAHPSGNEPGSAVAGTSTGGKAASQATQDQDKIASLDGSTRDESLDRLDSEGPGREPADEDLLGNRSASTSSASGSSIPVEEYELVGMLLGLAIYNSCILNVKFPRVLYKKLLNGLVGLEQTDSRRSGLEKTGLPRKLLKRPYTLDDIQGLDPSFAKGLRDLLSFDGNVEEIFARSFQVEVEDVYGFNHVIDLKPGGADIPLTNQNRQEYVDLCIQFYVESAVKLQFEAFVKGFRHCCSSTSLFNFFEPEELELLVCGNAELDFEDLEKGAKYTDGYTKSSNAIKQFWEVPFRRSTERRNGIHVMRSYVSKHQIANGLSQEDKRNLLMFVTGCERSPINGLSSLQFTISRNGPDSDRLPTAHTCFNHLLLPEYSSLEKMKDRLLTAIHNAQGFGLQ